MSEYRKCCGKNLDESNCQNRVRKGRNYCNQHRKQDPNYNQSTPAFENGRYFGSNGLNSGAVGAGGGTSNRYQSSSSLSVPSSNATSDRCQESSSFGNGGAGGGTSNCYQSSSHLSAPSSNATNSGASSSNDSVCGFKKYNNLTLSVSEELITPSNSCATIPVTLILQKTIGKEKISVEIEISDVLSSPLLENLFFKGDRTAKDAVAIRMGRDRDYFHSIEKDIMDNIYSIIEYVNANDGFTANITIKDSEPNNATAFDSNGDVLYKGLITRLKPTQVSHEDFDLLKHVTEDIEN